jgi:hypothetical protein
VSRASSTPGQVSGHGLLQLAASAAKVGAPVPSTRRGVQQHGAHPGAVQGVGRLGQAGQVGKLPGERLHRRVHRALLVGQRKLHPLGQRGLQRLEGVEAAKAATASR